MTPSVLLLGAALTWLGLLLIPLAAAWTRSPDLAHGWAAVFLLAHLWWERLPRETPRPPARFPRWTLAAAFALALIAAGLRVFLEPFPLWPGALALHTVALLALGGLAAWRVGGPSLSRWLLAPCIVFAGALPLPGIVDRGLLQPLRESLATLAAETLTLFSAPAVAEGTSVRLAGGWVGIDEACGGIRSLQAALMLALFFGELGRFPLARRAGLLFAALLAAFAGNLARILFLAAVAGDGPDRIAAVHDSAGWLALGLTLSGVGGVAWLLRIQVSAPPAPAPSSSTSTATTKAALLVRPTLGWLLAPLALLAFGEIGTRAWFASDETRQTDLPGWSLRLPATRPGFEYEALGETAREMLQPDRYEAGRWRDEAGERVAAYTIEWRRGQLARTLPFLHNPTVCLPLAGCELRETLPVEDIHVGDLSLPFRRYLFSRAGEEFLVSFLVWDPTRGEPLRQPGDSMGLRAWLASRWREVAERRRHQPAQMACVAVFGADSEPRSKALLESLVNPWSSETTQGDLQKGD